MAAAVIVPMPTSALNTLSTPTADIALAEDVSRPSIVSLSSPNPILYLPPILSSLPENTLSVEAPVYIQGSNPLTTDSRLPSIDTASLALHTELHRFHPITSDYASVPYDLAFNWEDLHLPESAEGEWYCVVFRSKRREGSNSGPLYEADRKAHEEAVQNGGLLMYWYGTPHPETGANLATCIWQSRDHAAAANHRPHHVRAMRLAAAAYEYYVLERHWLRKAKGETRLKLEPFVALPAQ
ncbi:uncharacterized protein FIBRA_07950 [Fibroporia radiculosa]|uniref:Uncharacterized protein n=1 Tax=Fibroporia radiculosa TaxID=599839 RepID=J4GG06_9APHY|nr:uncharacterized protein FIBRA_07950 [Fibroporia radiculosa]CCM05718.1 predicted protein [Fibroporia radiculosa]